MAGTWSSPRCGQLAEGIRAARLSPVALAETFPIAGALGPRYNAVVTVTRARALDAARRAEAEIAAGRYRGPLHGIPYSRQLPARDKLRRHPDHVGLRALQGPLFDFDATRGAEALAAGRGALREAARMVELAAAWAPAKPNAAFTGPASIRGTGAVERRLVERLGLRGSRRARALRHRVGDVGSILSPPATAASRVCGRLRGESHGAMALLLDLDKLAAGPHRRDDCGFVWMPSRGAIGGSDHGGPAPTATTAGEPAGRRFASVVCAHHRRLAGRGAGEFAPSLDVLRGWAPSRRSRSRTLP